MAKGIHEERYRALIAVLAEGRRRAGLNQTKLAAMLGKRQQFVSKYESGERRLDVVEFIDIASALGIHWMPLLEVCSRAPGALPIDKVG